MTTATPLLALPLELQEQVIGELEFPDTICLKITCRHFNTIIRSLSHEELLRAEETEFGWQADIYACLDCLCLRPASRFADQMLKRRKGKFHSESHKRFCVECGLQPGPGKTRYTLGSHILIQNVHHVICERCRKFSLGAVEDNHNLAECVACWTRAKAYRDELRRREEEYQRRERRARLKAEQAARRALRREMYYSASDSDELSESVTWEDEQLAMIQAEADQYMNSPKAGSE